MSEAFTGEIRMFSGATPPDKWVFCNGQLLDASQFDVLFTLIGNMYGGDGMSNFAVPDLRARIPVSTDSLHPLASAGGAETELLLEASVPDHAHALRASTALANSNTPSGSSMLAKTATNLVWRSVTEVTGDVAMSPSSIGFTRAATTPIPTVAPSLAIAYIICTDGHYPPHSS